MKQNWIGAGNSSYNKIIGEKKRNVGPSRYVELLSGNYEKLKTLVRIQYQSLFGKF